MPQSRIQNPPGPLRVERLPDGSRQLARDLVVDVSPTTTPHLVRVDEGSPQITAVFPGVSGG